MGILATEWAGEHGGHRVVVSRNEWTKGFRLEWDGEEIARRTWSLVGLGELKASTELAGKSVEVVASLEWDGFNDGKCSVAVDGQPIAMNKVK